MFKESYYLPESGSRYKVNQYGKYLLTIFNVRENQGHPTE